VVHGTKEAEISRILVPEQPRQKSKKVRKTPSQRENLGILAHIYYPSYSRKHKIERFQSRLTGPKARPYLQNNQSKNGRRCGSSGRMCAGVKH
jgi:hypothetical protein